MRDLEWTPKDYYWLCRRKRGQLSLAERRRFADAPVIMDFRRATDENPEDNCDCYNKMHLRAMAHKEKLPVIRITAEHIGCTEEEGRKMDEEKFNGLPLDCELAEGARVILIHNLAVEHGLMNGTQGIVQQVVFRTNHHPKHDRLDCRAPEAVVVDFPQYAGPSFYAEAERATWVPILRREVADGANHTVQRCQFPLILGWAMTPWKAQGMTLEKAIVRLTRAAASPGVAFVALSRVRHPDHLMLEDTFPDLATIMRQGDKESFQARQRWERRMRAHFSRTVRAYMHASETYSHEKVWTEEENKVAELFLETVRENNEAAEEDILQRCQGKTLLTTWYS